MRALFVFISFFCTSCLLADSIRLSAPVSSTDTSETFGAMFTEQMPAISLKELMATSDQNANKTFVLETEIASVCQKKGCFFIARQGTTAVRVSFKDYGFFIPTDSSGKTVTLVGELVTKQYSQEEAKHFTQDTKGSASVKAGKTYEIVASSVTIPKT